MTLAKLRATPIFGYPIDEYFQIPYLFAIIYSPEVLRERLCIGVIVNAPNSYLKQGGGFAAAIVRK